MPELDDCEEDDHFLPEDEWDDEVWAGYAAEQIEQFKTLGARLEKEEVRDRDGLLAACLKFTQAEHQSALVLDTSCATAVCTIFLVKLQVLLFASHLPLVVGRTTEE